MTIDFNLKIGHGKYSGNTHGQRFLSGFVRGSENDCWIWQRKSLVLRIKLRSVLISHVAYEYFIGLIEPGYSILHTCRNPRCVNPNHLYASRYFQDFIDNFIEKIQITDSCWNWIGSLNKCGYGRIALNGKVKMAHRIAYELAYGEIPDGVQVLHHCDNPSCVNPNHLFSGTRSDNMRDMVNKHRNKHPLYNKDNPQPKFLENEVIEIKSLLKSMSIKGIAEKLNVKEDRIKGISRGKNYKWVTE